MSRLVFHDLTGPERTPTPDENEWLTALTHDIDTDEFLVGIGTSLAATEDEPILQRQLDGSWKAGRYIGELYRGGRVLEIRPRLGIETIAAWAGAALNVRIVPQAAEHGTTATLIAELLAATWRSALIEAARHGPPGLRAPRRHIAEHVKGRLDLGQTLKLRATRQPQLISVTRPKEVDNPVSRVIVLADRVLNSRLRGRDWRGERVEELLPRLRAATGTRPPLPTRRELDAVRYTPITLPYKRIAELSWRIARRRIPHPTATGDRCDGLLIDVAELWELFLVHCAKRAFGSSEVTHGTHLRDGQPLLRSATTDASLGRLYPDLLIGPVDAPHAVIDAKYKPLADPRGVDTTDLYQLNAYLGVHTTDPLPLGALAYVRFPDQVTLSSAERRGPWTTTQGHTVHFQRLPITESACVKALRELAPIAYRH